MGFHNAVVIEADPLAESILGDLETAIDIAAERRGEIEADGEGQRLRSQPMHQALFVRGLGEGQPELLTDMLLIRATGRRQDPAALNRGVLMIDARRDRQCDRDGLGRHDCRRRRDMKRRSGTGLSSGWAQIGNGRLFQCRFRFGCWPIGDNANGNFRVGGACTTSVSYTHLTLPTSDLV